MKNRKIKLLPVALLVFSASAITGCSNLKSYKNKVTEEEFNEKFEKAFENFQKDLISKSNNYYNKSLKYNYESKTKDKKSTTCNKSKTYANITKTSSSGFLYDFDGKAYQQETNSEYVYETQGRKEKSSSKGNTTCYSEDINVYYLDNISKSYSKRECTSAQDANMYVDTRIGSLFTSSITTTEISRAFNLKVTDGTIEYYVDNNTFTLSYVFDNSKQSKAYTSQISFDDSSITLVHEKSEKSENQIIKITSEKEEKYKETKSSEFKYKVTIDLYDDKIVVKEEQEEESEEDDGKPENTVIKSSSEFSSTATLKIQKVSVKKSIKGYVEEKSSY